MKKWIIGKPDAQAVSNLRDKGGLTELCASVLVSRGIDTLEKAAVFFNSDKDKNKGMPLSDPFLIKDMPEAAERISRAIDNGELICIYGDYDCDGITSTAMLYSYIDCLGGNVIYHINMRDDGYGLCESAIRSLAEKNVRLIVTVDNGISAINEARLAAELGMELVITDHHQPGDILPQAVAVVDPHRSDCPSPYKNLCGCGVALKLIAALDGGDYSSVLEQFSDLAAIATIADIVPLDGENREIVIQGLHYIENTENVGLRALLDCAGCKSPINSTTAAFSLVPRINASGRFGSAADAVKLLICDDYDDALVMAQALDRLNTERKNEEKLINAAIEEKINADPSVLFDSVIVIDGENWHHGVIGIVAARLVERFCKPAFVISSDGKEARGSARSVEGFSIYEALSDCSELLTKFGGHTGAGGFSLEPSNISKFRRQLNDCAEKKYAPVPVYSIFADKIISPEELKTELIASLSSLEPYGEGNRTPIFLMHNVRLLEALPLSNGNHTKLRLTYGNTGIYGLMFGQKTEEFPYSPGDMLDMLVTAEINNFRGQTSVVVRISDLRPCGIKQVKFFNAKAAYEKFKRSGEADKALIPHIVPTRDELGVIFRKLTPNKQVSCDRIFAALGTETINYCKFRLGLDIFEELGLAMLDRFNDTAGAILNAPKADLGSSEILSRLKALDT